MKPRFMAAKLFLRQYLITLIICGVFFVAFMPWYSFYGMTIFFLIITLGLPIWVILGWLIIKAALVFKGKCSGKEFGVQIVLLCVTFFVAIPLAHLANEYVEQGELESLKERIELYKNQQGVLPARLEETGISGQDKRIYYKLNQNRTPILAYSSYSICGCLYVYDFQKHVWYTKGYNFGSVSESEYWDDVHMAD
ncbi:MAG TPA: hypothetical protein VIF86_05995 [Methylobacter sp.]